jgi:hypothetical protein
MDLSCEDEGRPMKKTCDVCGKEAIGIQVLGCCASTVCSEHAEKMLKDLNPGEKKPWGACYFERYEES